MKSKVFVGLLLSILYLYVIKTKKIKLLYKFILNLSIIEITYNFMKYHNTSNNNIILYIISLCKIILCKYLIKKNIFSDKKLSKLLLITSINDIFQEIIGKLIGKTKVTNISPKKTVEGYIGGYIVSLICGKIIFKKEINYLTKVYISNILGDLFFSLVKRNYGIKDFGKILHEHGGILDRYDSLILAIITSVN
jgi:phosphatidate cytidylyltransferase